MLETGTSPISDIASKLDIKLSLAKKIWHEYRTSRDSLPKNELLLSSIKDQEGHQNLTTSEKNELLNLFSVNIAAISSNIFFINEIMKEIQQNNIIIDMLLKIIRNPMQELNEI